MDKIIKISPRLRCVADFVRDGAVLADIGTDHAYIPVFLALSGRLTKAIASDVAPGPLKKAENNIFMYNVQDIVSVRLGDGLLGLGDENLTDIVIAGMGGELIARIIDDAPFVKIAGLRLILQPMTRPEALRGYLYKNGFNIIDEALVLDGRIYQVICAEYDGRQREASGVEMCIGPCNLRRKDDILMRETLMRLKRRMFDAYNAKSTSGADCSYEKRILDEINNYEK